MRSASDPLAPRTAGAHRRSAPGLAASVLCGAVMALCTATSPVVEARPVTAAPAKAYPAKGRASVTADPLIVQTTYGTIKGKTDAENTYTWQSIPYAQPPVGDRRWKAPLPPTAWTGTKDTTALPPTCPQTDSDSPTGVSGAEDCLFLNVWRPTTESTTPRPVMVFIHGGSNTSGSTSFGMYYGSHLAAKGDVVLVTLQYRLSMMGFFNHPALKTGNPLDDSGNFAILDQMKALEWVKANAKAFGGDPTKVTVFGESAGGFDIWSLILSEMADGLFQRAIVQSGCPLTNTVPQAQANAQAMIEAMVVADGLTTASEAAIFLNSMGNAWIRSYLYAKPIDEALTSIGGANLGITAFYTAEDGYVQRPNALARLETGDFTGVPTIIGSNRDEMKAFYLSLYGMKRQTYDEQLDAYYGDLVDEIESHYPMSDYHRPYYYNRFSDINDWWLQDVCGTYAATLLAPYQPTWLYQFRYDDLRPAYDELLGACHAAELPFIFGNFADELYPESTWANRDAVSDTMIGLWSCMARTGDPSTCTGLPGWSRLELGGVNALQRMAFDTSVRQETVPASDLEKIDFWNSYYGINAELPNVRMSGERQSTLLPELANNPLLLP